MNIQFLQNERELRVQTLYIRRKYIVSYVKSKGFILFNFVYTKILEVDRFFCNLSYGILKYSQYTILTFT